MKTELSTKKVYFEAGAHDGVFQSRTIHLKDRTDYIGILVEPTAEEYNRCIQNRKNENTFIYNCALVSFDYPQDKIRLYSCPMSAMNITEASLLNYKEYPQNAIEVQARTIQSILDENKIIEIEEMYLDVEGAEKNLLLGIDFNRTKINFLEIETHLWVYKTMTVEEEIEIYKEILNDYMKFQSIDYSEGHPKAIFKKE